MPATTPTTTQQREKLEALIDRAEADLRQDPAAYKRRIVLLTALGYAYLFGVLGLALALLAVCAWIAVQSTSALVLIVESKIGFVLLFVLYVVLRALWVRVDPPRGRRLAYAEAPALFDAVDRIGRSINAPPMHEIVLTADLNAAIQQTPRLGVFGWQRNSLILGMPLMLATSCDQCLAVIGHEFGHLSGQHSRFHGWIYRVRMTWLRVMDAFDHAGHWARVVFGRFFDWYAPYFSAYTFALARANEFEADAMAASAVSPRALAESLVRTEVVSPLLQKNFWEPIVNQAKERPEVNRSVLSGLHKFLRARPFSAEEMDGALAAALRRETGHMDTHPALADRVRPLMAEIPPVREPDSCAAEEFVGEGLRDLLWDLDEDWAEEQRAGWEARYAEAQASRARLLELEERRTGLVLKDDECWELARFTEDLRPEVDPLPLYQDYLSRRPGFFEAQFAVGRLLLARNDPAGLPHLERAMSHRFALIPACELAYQFHKRRGEEDAAQQVRLRAEAHNDILVQAGAERRLVAHTDVFLSPRVTEGFKNQLRRRLRGISRLKHVWICRKEVKQFPDDPAYVFIIETGFSGREDKVITEIVQALADMEGLTSIFVVGKYGELKEIARAALKPAERLF